MNFVDIFGVIGILLFFIKIGIHIYVKRKVDKDFHLGALGQFTNPVLFFPITDDVVGYLKLVKRAGNVIYLAAIILILTFLIGTNLH